MLRWCTVLLLLLVGSAQAQSPPWALPDGFVLDTVATDLFLPVNVALAPASTDPNAPLAYVTELYGRVKVITHGGDVFVYADDLLNFEPTGNFPGSGELGVTGLAVEPETGDLFVTLVYEDNGIKNRVVRMISAADGLSAEALVTLLEGIPGPIQSHQIQQATIGPDGLLYVQVGDGFVGDAAQDDDDLRGKILRLNLDGSLPADNPTPGSYVYAKGVRNPFGGAWRPDDGLLYISDNGPGENDRIVRVEAGGNYGWPGSLFPGAIHLWTPTVAPTAVSFCDPTDFPDHYKGRLYVGLSGPTYRQGPTPRGKRIELFTLDDDGEVVAMDTLMQYVGAGYGTVVGLACGADGLYFTDLYGEEGFDEMGLTQANLYRIRFASTVPVEETPEAVTALQPTLYPNPFTDRLTVEASIPPGPWTLEVFDLLGRRLHHREGHQTAGSLRVRWDGYDETQRTVPAGLYLVRLDTSIGSVTRPVVRLR